MPALPRLADLARQLAAGGLRSRDLVEQCLARIHDPAGEGGRAFIAVNDAGARAAADAVDRARAAGRPLPPLAGIPLSVKDLFDLAGEVTRAGSVVLADAPPAAADAPAIARLREAGAIIIGRTNMTEFAYGANGLNAHYGTPRNPWDRATGRIAGGSTSGGAVSVTDGMAAATIGSDTGGSVRIPAALTGLAGFKPTQRRVPLTGAFPLSFTRDSIGPLGTGIACCAWLDAVMAGTPRRTLSPPALAGMTFGVPTTVVLDALEGPVAAAFARALTTLSAAGARIEEFAFEELARERDGSRAANFSAVEAYALHRARLATEGGRYDPRVRRRLMMGADMRAADYVDLLKLRESIMASSPLRTARYDALLMPTVPIVAPPLADLESSDEAFFRINALLLRNCAPFNVLDRPCATIPCERAGEPPVGLMVAGETMGDDKVLAVALAVESALEEAARA